MQKRKLIFYSLLLAAIAAGFFFRVEISDYLKPKIEKELQNFEKIASDALVKELKKQTADLPKLNAPEPLRYAPSAPKTSTTLTASGTIEATNAERIKAGLQPLSENKLLDSVADLRMKDLFDNQYFDHVSPVGNDAETLAKRFGYQYLVLGENLALGIFAGDKGLVDAWMASPGHRANILNTRYGEIGVSVGKGVFEGKTLWIAVQIFAKPLSACPAVDQSLKERIGNLKNELDAIQKDLEARRAEIEAMNQRDPGYREKVDEYNALVAQYNDLAAEFKADVSTYNSQISGLNACIESGG